MFWRAAIEFLLVSRAASSVAFPSTKELLFLDGRPIDVKRIILEGDVNVTLSMTEHDRGVRYFAMQMLAQGYDVKARVEGWFTEPDVILGYRPDIVALKNDEYVIVEIKKGDVDWPKIRALEKFAVGHPGIRFLLITPEEVRTKLPLL